MMASIQVATPNEIPEVLQIYAPYILHTTITFEYEVPNHQAFAQRYHAIANQFPFLVCKINDKVAGYAYAAKAFSRAAYQWDADLSVYVAEDYWHRGIASALYRCLEQLLCLQGYCLLYALVTKENENSLAFHKHMGFVQTATLPKTGFKFGRWHDLVWLQKQINCQSAEPTVPIPFHQLQKTRVQEILRKESDTIFI